MIDEIFNRYRLAIILIKTKSMILDNQYRRTDYPPFIAKLRGEKLTNIVTYRYLGCEVKYDEPKTGDAELTLRYDAVDSKFYTLSMNTMNNKIKLKTRNDKKAIKKRRRLVELRVFTN